MPPPARTSAPATEPDTEPDLPDTAADGPLDDAPVLGRRKKPSRRTTFALATYDSRDREQQHRMTARVDMDAASVFGFMSPRMSEGERVGALRDFLLRALVDDDGIGRHEDVVAVIPAGGAPADTPQDDTPPNDEVDSSPVAVGDAAVEEWMPLSEAGDDYRTGDIRYRIGDNTVWPSVAAAVDHGRVHGSSLRRFKAIMDDDALTVEQTALEEIVDHVIRRGADRPTKRSSGSSRSRTRKGR